MPVKIEVVLKTEALNNPDNYEIRTTEYENDFEWINAREKEEKDGKKRGTYFKSLTAEGAKGQSELYIKDFLGLPPEIENSDEEL